VHLVPLTIYEAADYFETLTRLVSQTKSGGRIALMTMGFEPDEPHIHKLVRELIAAAKRGVQVYLLVDAQAFSMDAQDIPNGPVLLLQAPATSHRAYFRRKYLLLEELNRSGGTYRVTNMPDRRLANPYAGRSHIKLAVVNDTVFVGGCNLGRMQIDYMVQIQDTKAVEQLYDLAVQTAETGSVRETLHDTDLELAIDTQTTLFIDAGVPKQSVIYEKALDFIDCAHVQLTMTCQYFPNTVTARHLASAVERGVDVALYYNHPRHHAIHMRPVHHAVIWAEKARQPGELFARQLPKKFERLHAKLLASEQGAFVGSHNYVTHGVNFGTAEIALLRHDPIFAQTALDVLKRRLPPGF
jgi:phosphatidylserine/phosphatidylglycerophosphate/cardiolipin synthase-like enzyme